jgi:glycosyltransferase involved in cell wall biosynthesis
VRVLHVIPSLSPKHGGPSFALPLIIRASALYGIRTTVATTDDDGPGARVSVRTGERSRTGEHSDAIYFPKQTEFYKASWSLNRWLRRHASAYDVVHIHALFSFSSVAAAWAARRAAVPYIVRPLGVLNRWGMQNRRRWLKQQSLQLLEIPILRNAAAIHYTASAERAEAEAAMPFLATRSVIIPVPIAPNAEGDPERLRQRFSQLADGPVVLFLSRISPKKRLEVLLEAMVEVRAHVPRVRLLIAGDGDVDYVNALKQKAHRLLLDDVVVWAGHLAAEDKAAAFAIAGVFVLPSASENFGIAVAEAFAQRVPAVISPEVAISGEARERDAASVVAGEPRPIADAVVELLQDTEKARRLAANAAAMVAARFSLDAVGRELKQLYDSVTDGKASATKPLNGI